MPDGTESQSNTPVGDTLSHVAQASPLDLE